MDKLILFSQSIHSLSSTEYQKCLELIDRDVLTSIMFKMLHHDVMNNKLDNVEEINTIIKKIKESRTKQKENNNIDDNEEDDHGEENIEIKLDDIPYVLLLEISSFLPFDDKIRFEQTNSSIFIALKSNKLPLYSLSDHTFVKLIDYATKCNNINKKKYISKMKIFKSLTINCAQVVPWEGGYNYKIKYPFNYFELFDNIKTLEIQCENSFDLHCLLSHLFQITNLPNLQTLRITSIQSAKSDIPFICEEDPLHLDRFKEHPNLQFVEVTAWIETNSHNGRFNHYNYNYEWVSSLKGIAVMNLYYDADEDPILENIYRSLGDNKLQSLHIQTLVTLVTLPAINGKLNNLKEICLSLNTLFHKWCNVNGAMLLKQTINTLERVYLRIGKLFTGDEEREPLAQLSMNELIKSVKYIGLSVDKEFFSTNMTFVLNAMGILIRSLQHINKKHTLKIRIDNIFIDKTDEICNVLTKLNELIQILNIKCIDWMLIGYNWKAFENNKFLIDSLKIMKNKYNVIHYVTSNSFVIKNKQCRINGYYEPWIMKCQCCQQHPLVS